MVNLIHTIPSHNQASPGNESILRSADVFYNFAIHHDQGDVVNLFQRANIFQRIGAGEDQVGEFTLFECSQVILPSRALSGNLSWREDGFHGTRSDIDLETELTEQVY